MSLAATPKYPSVIATETDMLNWKNISPTATIPSLAADITAGATSFSVATGTGAALPSDNFVVSIDSEILFVGSRSGDALSSIIRGFESTSAATHGAGATVNPMMTAKAHNQIAAEVYAVQTALGVNLANVQKPNRTVNALTANTSLTTTHDVVLVDCTSGGFTVTLPTAVGNSGKQYVIKRSETTASTNIVTVATTSSQTIDGATSYFLINQYQYIKIVSDGANWFIFGQN